MRPSSPKSSASRPRAPRAWLALLSVVAGCGAERTPETAAAREAAGGTLVIATVGDPDHLVPPIVTSLQGAQIVAQLFDRLAEIGHSLNTVGDADFRPRLARTWTWAPDSLSVRFAIDPRARWHDGAPVTARDVAFSFGLYRDPRTASSIAPLLAEIDSVTTADSMTAVVWFARRSPQQFFDAVHQVHVLPEHRLRGVDPSQLASSAFAREPIGSGRFRFVRWERGARIELVADTANWRGRPQLDRAIWAVHPDPGAATRALATGAVDWWESVRGEGLQLVRGTPSLRAMPYASLDQGYLAFNLRAAGGVHPILGDRVVRRALAGAIDRARVVRNVFDSAAAVRTVPAPRTIAAAVPEPVGPPYDAARAARELEAAGWRDTDGDGIRERAGKRLAVRLLVHTTSAARRQLAVLVQEQLKQVGAEVTIDALDPAAFAQAAQRGEWDAMLEAWHADPDPRGILQRWGAPGKDGRGGANATGYHGAAFEALVDSASATFDPARSAALFARAYAALADDAPAVWLFEMRNVAGAHRRLRPAPLRADAWWADLADWTIPAAERGPRDRAGALAVAR
ncbi:MAG: peptide ABC transporter substrate-binding protein [Gemmatirosa sp.]